MKFFLEYHIHFILRSQIALTNSNLSLQELFHVYLYVAGMTHYHRDYFKAHFIILVHSEWQIEKTTVFFEFKLVEVESMNMIFFYYHIHFTLRSHVALTNSNLSFQELFYDYCMQDVGIQENVAGITHYHRDYFKAHFIILVHSAW